MFDLGELLDSKVPWHKLPPILGAFVLAGIRRRLRERNLVDTGLVQPADLNLDTDTRDLRRARTEDGGFNDLTTPEMGCRHQRFGRNVPIDKTWPDNAKLLEPNPRLISQRLLARRRFQPATTLNVLAAAWIQFQNHDWFAHSNDDRARPIEIPVAPDDPWHERPMRVRPTERDPQGDPSKPPVYRNQVTHWWDASQLYGSDAATQKRLRAFNGGKLVLGRDGLLPVDPATGIDITGFNSNWWHGLAALHTLFTREHNAICDTLAAHYPTLADQQLFDKARLVNAALMAKIHTVEWTPGILAHPTLKLGMNANWWGLASEEVKKEFGRLGSNEELSGIPGSPVNHHGAPYSVTEEFVAVYRLHSLMPDTFEIRSTGNKLLAELGLLEVAGRNARGVVAEHGIDNVLYSLGVSHPGALTLHNFPEQLRRLVTDDGSILDLASIDILRDRERGVPRYNEFRRLLGLPAMESFEDLCNGDAAAAAELRAVYSDLEAVDLLVGTLAETPPRGFGFSETQFYVFILMASRRLKSDRFFTDNYDDETYTEAGMRWVEHTTMRDVLLRHYPSLGPALEGVENPFGPWRRG